MFCLSMEFTFLFLERNESFSTFQQKGRPLDDGEHRPDILLGIHVLRILILLLLFGVSKLHSFLGDLSFYLRKNNYVILNSSR